MNKNIGFRVKLDDYIAEKQKISEFLYLYFSKFDLLEVKVNNNLAKSKNLEYILNELKNKNVSFHLSKDFINSPTEYDEIILSYIQNDNLFLITHVPEVFNKKSIELAMKKITNNMLLFENPNKFQKKYYIEYLILFYNFLSLFNNCGICLDLGHLYYNELINSQKYNLVKLLENINVEQIREYHVHDFNKSKDHLKIGAGLLKNVKINNCMVTNARIILETNVDRDDLSDGEEQVKKVLTKIL